MGRCFLGRSGGQTWRRRGGLARAAVASRARRMPCAVHRHGRGRQGPPVLRGFSACRRRARITTPSSGHTTAGAFVLLRQRCARRCMPLMSNVSRHMQPHVLRELACVKRSFVLRERAAWQSAVCSRKVQLAQPLRRAVRPAAAGAPIVEAPPEQRPASRRAARPSAVSAPKRKRARKFGGLRSKVQCFSTRSNSRACPGPASTQRLRCIVLAPRPASAMRPMPAAVSVAFVACKGRKRCAVATTVLSASKRTP